MENMQVKILRSVYYGQTILKAGEIVSLPKGTAIGFISSNKAIPVKEVKKPEPNIAEEEALKAAQKEAAKETRWEERKEAREEERKEAAKEDRKAAKEEDRKAAKEAADLKKHI